MNDVASKATIITATQRTAAKAGDSMIEEARANDRPPEKARRRRKSNRWLILVIVILALTSIGVIVALGQQILTANDRPLQTIAQRNVVVTEARAKTNPRDVEAQLEAGKALLVAGEYDRGIAYADRALGAQKDNPGALQLKADGLVLKGDLKSARAILERILKSTSKAGGIYADASLSLARIDEQEGKLEAAVKDLETGILRDPSNATLQVQLARLQSKVGKKDAAVASYSEALRYIPDMPEAVQGLQDMKYGPADYALAKAAWEKGDKAAALQLMDQAMTHSPNIAWLHVALGDLRSMSGDAAGARAAYNQALALDPTNKEAAAGLAALK
ncbi:MAG: tetratricopeptide repeat protein [Actinobacteria bacterium]|nr:tetratricopeptide repeat protein [Actinomycetota bacterium]